MDLLSPELIDQIVLYCCSRSYGGIYYREVSTLYNASKVFWVLSNRVIEGVIPQFELPDNNVLDNFSGIFKAHPDLLWKFSRMQNEYLRKFTHNVNLLMHNDIEKVFVCEYCGSFMDHSDEARIHPVTLEEEDIYSSYYPFIEELPDLEPYRCSQCDCFICIECRNILGSTSCCDKLIATICVPCTVKNFKIMYAANKGIECTCIECPKK